MARLRSVAIRRFKRIEQIEIPLGDVTLLIGANNSGKSSILQAIHFAVSLAQTARLVGEGVAWRQDKFELSFNPSQLLYSPVADVLSLATGGTLLEPRPPNRDRVQSRRRRKHCCWSSAWPQPQYRCFPHR